MNTNPQHRLDFGSLDLVSRDGQAGAYWFGVLADGFSPGSPESVKAVVEGLANTDGEFSYNQRSSNRTVTFNVVVEGTDSLALAEGGRLLDLECRKRSTTLTWTPPDLFGPPTVYVVVRAEPPRQQPDDLDELRNIRTFTVTLECRPFTRSVDVVTFTHGTGVTLLSNCNTMTGWTVVSGAATSDGTEIDITSPTSVLDFVPTVPLDNYLSFDLAGIASSSAVTVSIGGVVVPGANWKGDDLAGVDPIIVPTGAARGTLATIRFTGGTGVSIRQVDTLSYARNGDASPSVVVSERYGSARAPLTLSAYRSDGALGDVFFYTAPDPVELIQRGTPVAVFGAVTVAGGGLDGNGQGGVVSVDGVPKWFPTGTFTDTLGVSKPQAAFTGRHLYPPTPTIVTTAPGGGSVTLGTTYQYPTDRDAAVIFLKNVTYKGLWIIPPSPDMPEGGIFGGNLADGSDAVALTDEIKVYQPLAIHPEYSGLLASASNGGTVFTGSYYPAWPNHAAM